MPTAIPWPGFCGAAYQQQGFAIDRAVNLYSHSSETGTGKNQQPAMKTRPGCTLFASPGQGIGRGIFLVNYPTSPATVTPDQFVGCAGSKFFTISSGGVVSVVGDIGGGNFPCQVFSSVNTFQVLILNVDTGQVYVWDGATLAAITTPVGFYSITYLDGFAYGVGNGNLIYQSDLDDFTNWNALDFGTRLDASDFVQVLFSDHETLLLAGQRTSSFWATSGASGFAQARIPSAFIQEGIGAPFSICSSSTPRGTVTVMVTKSDTGFGRVVVVRQGTVDRISTYAIENIIQSAGSTYDLIGASAQFGGHSFYLLSSPSAGFKLVYDFTEKAWHEWDAGEEGSGETPAFHLNVGVVSSPGFGTGKHFGMMRTTGQIFLYSVDLVSDAGINFRPYREAPVLYTGKRFSVQRLRIDEQMGDGLGMGHSVDAVFSRDGGQSFDPLFTTAVKDQYGPGTGIQWRYLGQARNEGFSALVKWTGLTAPLVVSGAEISVTDDEA